MNAERLLALNDRVAEAPDAAVRLRGFVLELAVRGSWSSRIQRMNRRRSFRKGLRWREKQNSDG